MKQLKLEDDNYLDERLAAYAALDYYPFHMPGHKRKALPFENPYRMDITEIDGFDNLHHAQGILLQAQERLQKLYGSRRAYYLINGSTCGLLSAIGAVTMPGDDVLIARNCHKAVYNAVKIFRLRADYLYPALMTCGIQGVISPAQVETALKKNQKIKAVVITSPTYDGIVSDVRKIADVVHKYHAHLIIDEAHGAHFSLSPHFPVSAVSCGADIVIQSLHKTLPSFTQTAALHIAGADVDEKRVGEMLGIFQTSSPSYVLMAGIERCVRLLLDAGDRLFLDYKKRLDAFYRQCRGLCSLRVLTPDDYKGCGVYDVDASKIVISTLHAPIDGRQLYGRLLSEYHLQMEMCSAQYVLAMTSVMDTDEGFARLAGALSRIDADFAGKDACGQQSGYGGFMERAYEKREKVYEIADCDTLVKRPTDTADCAGAVCGEYIYLYPPGIPMIVPGETIPDYFKELLEECRARGLCVQGTADMDYRKILTVAQPV